jgi:hypothetical protein
VTILRSAIAASAIVTGLVVLPAPAHAATYTVHLGYTTKAACVTESGKPAYNNSFVRVVRSCYPFDGGWAFDTRSIA